MSDLIPNDYKIIRWCNRMISLGWCGAVTEVLADKMGEMGNESPSDEAVKQSEVWEKDEDDMKKYIISRHEWCTRPTIGCITGCNRWKESWAKEDN